MTRKNGCHPAGPRIVKGRHVYHHPSGDYLGVATGPPSATGVVRFNGPRIRDGHPVTMCSISEVRPGPAPKEAG